MVGIQVGNEQEERKGEEKKMIRENKDFIVPSNAGEDFCGSDYDDMTYTYSCSSAERRERRERDDACRGGL